MENGSAKLKNEFKNRLYAWVLRLIAFVDKLPKTPACDVIGKQLLRSGTSVLANYSEANSASSRRDFINFFTYSLKSANESEIWLSLLRDTNKRTNAELGWLLKELVEISKIIASSILTLKKRSDF
jgi:four helix bundle protein